MKAKKRVAMLLSTWASTNTTRGIMDYAMQHDHWRLIISPGMDSYTSVQSLKGWDGDGIIALIAKRAEIKAAAKFNIPVVNTSGTFQETGWPRVSVDHRAVGRLAAEHLLECGFRRFAYCGLRGAWFSQERYLGLQERVAKLGCSCARLDLPAFHRQQIWMPWMERLEAWLKTLQTPVGLLVVHDPVANSVLDTCIRLGLRVPHDVAVIGVENVETICQSAEVPLSSVPCNGLRVGYEAAALLDRMMSGKRPPYENVVIPPEELIRRESTDVVAVEDQHVAAAVHYIRDNVNSVFGVEALDKVAGISRRTLEQRFREALHCSPHQYICKTRVERAKKLLSGPEKLQLQQIARLCGFSSIRNMRRTFERLAGMTPAEYRRRQMEIQQSNNPFSS